MLYLIITFEHSPDDESDSYPNDLFYKTLGSIDDTVYAIRKNSGHIWSNFGSDLCLCQHGINWFIF